MGEKQTWQVVASPRDRYQLAALLLHKDIKLKGNKSSRELHRARQALGLLAPHDAILAFKDAVNPHHRDDATTLHRFAVTSENAECVLGWHDKLEVNPAQSRWLADVLGQLEQPAHTLEGLVNGNPYDERADIELWKPTAKPLLENPWLFAEVLGDVIERATSWPEFRRLYAKGMEPEGPPASNGAEHAGSIEPA